MIIKQADDFGVSILLVRTNTMETIGTIEGVCRKTRLGQLANLQLFKALVAEHIDIERLYRALDLRR